MCTFKTFNTADISVDHAPTNKCHDLLILKVNNDK